MTITKIPCPNSEYVVQVEEDGKIIEMRSFKDSDSATNAIGFLTFTLMGIGYKGSITFAEDETKK